VSTHEDAAKRSEHITAEVAELVVHRQANSGAICFLLKDQEAEQSCEISDWTSDLIAASTEHRVCDPPVSPDLPEELRHRVHEAILHCKSVICFCHYCGGSED
jgi:hypothetical protein